MANSTEGRTETSDGKGLLSKESIQRTIKSKWFLPALAIGGAIVVLLVLSRRKGAGAATTGDELYPGTTPTDGGTPSTFDPSQFSSQIADLFGEFQSGIDKQIQQQNAAIEAGMTSQTEYLRSSVSGIESQLEGAVSQLQSGAGNVGYYDPYAGAGYGYDPMASYGMTGFGQDFATQPFAEPSMIEYTSPIADSYAEPSSSLTMEMQTGTAAAQSKLDKLASKTGIQAGGVAKQQAFAAQQSSALTPTTKIGKAAEAADTKQLNLGTSSILSAGAAGAPIGVSPINPAAVALYRSGLVPPPVRAVAGSTKPTSFIPSPKPPEVTPKAPQPVAKAPVPPPVKQAPRPATPPPQRIASGKARAK